MRFLAILVLSAISLFAGEREDFNKAYWASQPPAVRQLSQIQDPVVAEQAALSLALQGVTIDKPIMLWGWEPYMTMLLRSWYGYTWVPSLVMQPIIIAPGLQVPGVKPYDPANPPPGAIKVTLNIADYKPWKGL